MAKLARSLPLQSNYGSNIAQVVTIVTKNQIYFLGLSLLFVITACQNTDVPALMASVEDMSSPASSPSGEAFLSSSEDGVYLSWLEQVKPTTHELRFSILRDGEWSKPGVIAVGDDFFVNWADFPSIVMTPHGSLWAHWLQRGSEGGYDYGVRVAESNDGGRTWSDPFVPHEDETPTEHGFVSMMASGSGIGVVRLDGRNFVSGKDGEPASREMTLRFREIHAGGITGPESLLDGRVCDCCQTDAVVTPSGPVVVYRIRTADEIRDIYMTRFLDGSWTEGLAVHHDGWEIGGCPVNGPAGAMAGEQLAVAWFTGAADIPRVKVELGKVDGLSFNAPIQIDEGDPAGRVDIVGLSNGDYLVSWLERTGGETAEVRMRKVYPDGTVSEAITLTSSSSARASGFPRLVQHTDGSVVMAWTDVSTTNAQVRVKRIHLEKG